MSDMKGRLDSIQKYPRYCSNWKQTKLKRAASGQVHDLMSNLYGTILHLYSTLMSGMSLLHDEDPLLRS